MRRKGVGLTNTNENAGRAGARGNTMSYFRPTREPARSIHDALVREASKRNKRMPEEWL